MRRYFLEMFAEWPMVREDGEDVVMGRERARQLRIALFDLQPHPIDAFIRSDGQLVGLRLLVGDGKLRRHGCKQAYAEFTIGGPPETT
ncbi:hypothetical protein LZK76_10055 [Rhizobium leguminosarum]|nr:hypothetical protein LZK76_10055 [Rhizobium leguminosarum]